MKKIILLVSLAMLNHAVFSQTKNATVINKPDASFIQSLENAAKSFDLSKAVKLNANQLQFAKLITTAAKATGWSNEQYAIFMKQAAPIIKSMGVIADPDDGGEIFTANTKTNSGALVSAQLFKKAMGVVCSLICGLCCR